MFIHLQFHFSQTIRLFSENITSSDSFLSRVDSVINKLRDSHPYVKLMGHLIALSLIKILSGERQIEVAQKVLALMNLDELSGIDDLSQEHLTLNVRKSRNAKSLRLLYRPNSFFFFFFSSRPMTYLSEDILSQNLTANLR